MNGEHKAAEENPETDKLKHSVALRHFFYSEDFS